MTIKFEKGYLKVDWKMSIRCTISNFARIIFYANFDWKIDIYLFLFESKVFYCTVSFLFTTVLSFLVIFFIYNCFTNRKMRINFRVWFILFIWCCLDWFFNAWIQYRISLELLTRDGTIIVKTSFIAIIYPAIIVHRDERSLHFQN